MSGFGERLLTIMEERGRNMDKIRPAVVGRSKVRRCLFGKPDHNKIREDLDRQLKETNVSVISKWNYDFNADRPLEGRYEWHLVSQPEEYVPDFYTKGYSSRPRKVILDRTDLSPKSETDNSRVSSSTSSTMDSENSENILGCSRLDTENKCNSVNAGQSSSRNVRVTRKSKQSRIDEFMRQKKRKACNSEHNDQSHTKSPRREDS